MIIINWISVGIGAGAIILLVFLYWIFKPTKKPKYDLHNLRKLIYDTGIKTKEVFDNIKQLESFFEEIENVQKD